MAVVVAFDEDALGGKNADWTTRKTPNHPQQSNYGRDENFEMPRISCNVVGWWAALGGRSPIGLLLLHAIHSQAEVIIFALVFSCLQNFAGSAISVVGS